MDRYRRSVKVPPTMTGDVVEVTTKVAMLATFGTSLIALTFIPIVGHAAAGALAKPLGDMADNVSKAAGLLVDKIAGE